MTSKLYILSGTDKGKSFDLEHDSIYYVGRSPENDIQIKDENISNYHLKVHYRENKYFIADLNSKNGTFIAEKDISPVVEVEVKEGMPIVIGMSVIGLGEGCETWLKSFLDSVGIGNETYENGRFSKSYGVRIIKKKLGFIYDINNILIESKDKNEVSEKMLERISNLFEEIDGCLIILIDIEAEEIFNVLCQSQKTLEHPTTEYNRELVEQALVLNKAVGASDTCDKDYDITKSSQLKKNIRSAACVPICSPVYQNTGAIYIDSLARPYGFRKNELDLLKDISGIVGLAIDHLSLFNEFNSEVSDGPEFGEFFKLYGR